MGRVEAMTPDSLREFCLSLPLATETFPFGDETSVFKTDPEESIALRAEFAAIIPGYHLNKKHWITIRLDGSVEDDLVEQLISSSHALVRPRIPRARQ
jgi:predicted DNA-binding protein (MmcQ/YjbR family)